MASPKGLLLSAVGRLVLRHARVTAVEDLGGHLRRIALASDELRGASWTAGDKVQVLLPSKDVRTYTPLAWDRTRGATAVVAFDHGDSPGARWARTVKAGDPCGFVGPQRSITRTPTRPAILFGDETSLGVAHALGHVEPAAPLTCVLEVGDPAALAPALDLLGLDDAAVMIARRADDGHLAAVAAQLAAAHHAQRDAELIFTGRGQSIQALRTRLRELGVAARGPTKAYWSVGKSGLD